MRRLTLALPLCLLAGLPASAHAADVVGAPITHGADSAAVGAGPEATAPAGGPIGMTAGKTVLHSAGAVAKRLPTTWCGVDRGADDTIDETQHGGDKEHAGYMV